MANNKQSVILKNFCLISLVASVIFALLNTFCIMSYYDESVFLYQADAVLPKVLSAVLAVYALLALIVALAAKNNSLPAEAPSEGTAEKVLSAIIGVMLVLFSVVAIKDVLKIKEFKVVLTRSEIFMIIAGVFGILTAVYFLLRVFGNGNRKLRCVFGFFGIGFCVMKLLSLYFARTTHINNPIVVMEEFSLIAFMVYLLVEIRYEINIGKANFFLGFGSLSCMFLLVWSMADVVYRFSNTTLFEQDGILAIAELFLAVLVGIRMIKFILSNKDA